MPENRFGATPEEWDHFDQILGLTEDLLPVVSNPNAEVSETSSLEAIGKVPSKYNSVGKITGIKEWTSKLGNAQEIASWASVQDYGICVQTRNVRALDIDVEDAGIAQKIWVYLEDWGFPARARENSPKFLLGFRLDGAFAKRVIRVKGGGAVEFLATGQQFIAAGTHPSGARYAWVNGLPAEFPVISESEFELLWKSLHENFGEGESAGKDSGTARRPASGLSVRDNDPVLAHLENIGQVLSWGDGQVNIKCPFEAEHTTEGGESATSYFPAGSRGYEQGHFKCLHAHCEGRSDTVFLEALGYGGAWFSDLGPTPEAPNGTDGTDGTDGAPEIDTPQKGKLTLISYAEYQNRPRPQWIIDTILPRADLAVIFGESGSGKSFLALDMAIALARGVAWNGFAVRQSKVVYLCAEGSGGMRNRLRAFSIHHNFDPSGVPLLISPDQPNLLEATTAVDIVQSIRAAGGADVIFIDTLAQVTPGANENSAEDMGRAIAHCRKIGKALGALVILIHHAGKDLTKGARGWSGLRAAADAEIEVNRFDNQRWLRISKQKDGEDMNEWGFNLLKINVDMDEQDRIISSCAVEYTSLGRPQRGVKKLGRNEKLVLETFELMGGVRVAYGDLVTEAMKVIPPAEDGKRDRRKNLIQQAILNLAERGTIVYRDDTVFLPI